MTVRITKATARNAAAKLADHFGIVPEMFDIYEPGFHSSGWAIVSETGPYNWTGEASEILNADFGPILYEPVNHWCLALYVA
jgi:hypothetical protein